MPGGRLRLSERRYIAEALAQGLGYAEIARRLRRPTSTISREVARNGGRGGYRAEAAHRSTAERARRSPGARLRDSTGTGRDSTVLRDFRRRYIAMMTETGMPSMPAKVLVSLLTSDSGRLTAADLVRSLWVSPASVSKSVGYLEGIGLLRRAREPGARREQYIVDEDIWLDAWATALELQLRWARSAAEGARVLGEDTPAGVRLAMMAEFSERMTGSVSRELHRLRAEFDRRRSPS